MKYLSIVLFAFLVLAGCRSARNEYEAYSPLRSYESHVPSVDYKNSGSSVNFGGSVSSGASSGGCPSCR